MMDTSLFPPPFDELIPCAVAIARARLSAEGLKLLEVILEGEGDPEDAATLEMWELPERDQRILTGVVELIWEGYLRVLNPN